jgi:hypothetical protein
MFGFLMNSLYNYRLIKLINFILIARMKHSHIIYNPLTKSLIIDNSLKKDLEIAKKRNNKDNKDIQDNIQTIEMSESHGTQPYKKVKSNK